MVFSLYSQSEGTRLQKDLRTYLASVKGKVCVAEDCFCSSAYLCSEVSAAVHFLVFPLV